MDTLCSCLIAMVVELLTNIFVQTCSSLYGHLVPGDDVMTDRGFQIKEDALSLMHYHCTLNIPPAARAKSQMTPVECKKTKTIANLRIHVEQAINRIREFKILKNIMPIDMCWLVLFVSLYYLAS